MRVGDLVRPKSGPFRHQMGVVVKVNLLTTRIMLTNGRSALYNKDVLEIINGTPETKRDKLRKIYEYSISTWSTVFSKLVQAKNDRKRRTQGVRPFFARR